MGLSESEAPLVPAKVHEAVLKQCGTCSTTFLYTLEESKTVWVKATLAMT